MSFKLKLREEWRKDYSHKGNTMGEGLNVEKCLVLKKILTAKRLLGLGNIENM
jgi:hypothetical protein